VPDISRDHGADKMVGSTSNDKHHILRHLNRHQQGCHTLKSHTTLDLFLSSSEKLRSWLLVYHSTETDTVGQWLASHM